MLEMFRQSQTNIPIPDGLGNYPKTTWQNVSGFAYALPIDVNLRV